MRALAASVLALAFAAPAATAAMSLTSADLKPGAPAPIAQVYPRCGGANISPQLSWSGAPAATRSFALTIIDLSVEPHLWTHWIVVGLPADAASLARGVTVLPHGARALANDFGDAGYDGPCPPAGSGVHHYQVTIWALPGGEPAIAAKAPGDRILGRLERASIAHASLTVTAQR